MLQKGVCWLLAGQPPMGNEMSSWSGWDAVGCSGIAVPQPKGEMGVCISVCGSYICKPISTCVVPQFTAENASSEECAGLAAEEQRSVARDANSVLVRYWSAFHRLKSSCLGGQAGCVLWPLLLLHFMICHSNKCHRPRTSSCHKEQRGGTEYG